MYCIILFTTIHSNVFRIREKSIEHEGAQTGKKSIVHQNIEKENSALSFQCQTVLLPKSTEVSFDNDEIA